MEAVKIVSDYKPGKLVLIDDPERYCDFTGCHQGAVLQAIDYANGREWEGMCYCGFHGARLFGRRDA